MESTVMECKMCKEITEHVYSETDHCWVCLVCVNGGNKPEPKYPALDIIKEGKLISFEEFNKKWSIPQDDDFTRNPKKDKDSG